ncbi:MAG: carboxylating nicotinate-nucleotide diphosphorylase [Phycisphaerae bacterium]
MSPSSPRASWSSRTIQLIETALDEDLDTRGDLSGVLLHDAAAPVAARIVPRAAGVVCGLALAREICAAFARRCGTAPRIAAKIEPSAALADGRHVSAGQLIATLAGPKDAVLALERTLLNFLGRMSGVATLTRRFVEAIAGSGARIYDTRKTLPGWRELDKYAVRCGGGHNHRFGLFDAVLLKDNHLAGVPTARLADHVRALVARAPTDPPPAFIEVEVDAFEQFETLCGAPGVDIILLDNFSPADLRRAVELRDGRGLRGRVELEASGGVTLETVVAVAATGVDRIAIGALTHSAPALDLGLDL